MKERCHRGFVIALVLLPVACGRPTAPTEPTPTGAFAHAAPAPAAEFPAVVGPARIYLAANSWPQPSRYVLYEDGRFALQYLGIPDYRGTYTETAGAITFVWEGWSSAGSWGASGSITDTALTVHYNLIMQLSDFEDAVYSGVP